MEIPQTQQEEWPPTDHSVGYAEQLSLVVGNTSEGVSEATVSLWESGPSVEGLISTPPAPHLAVLLLKHTILTRGQWAYSHCSLGTIEFGKVWKPRLNFSLNFKHVESGTKGKRSSSLASLAQASVTNERPALTLRDLPGCGQLRMGRAYISVPSAS